MPPITAIAFLILSIFSPLDGRLVSRDGQWLLPVANTVLSSDEHDHTERGSINAWDLNTPQGNPVWAMGPGVVVYSGCNNQGGYGCWVMIDHPNGWQSRYAHCEVQPLVSSGQQVDATTQLCTVGWTGMTSFGPHTHFVVIVNGTHGMLDQIWDKAALPYCRLCAATGTQAPNVSAAAPTAASRLGLSNSPETWVMVLAGLLLVIALLILFPEVPAALGRWTLQALGKAAKAGARYAWAHRPRLQLAPAIVWGVVPGLFVLLIANPAALIAAAGSGLGAVVDNNAPFSMLNAQSSSADFDAALAITLGYEGGLADHPADPGGRTNRGVTQGTYDGWRRSQGQPTQAVDHITNEEVEAIYYQNYWLASGADKLPAALALAHFDWAVNAGVGQAAKTLAACQAADNPIKCYNDTREAFYRASRNFAIFGQGWLNRLASIRQATE